jgi:flagellar hook-length control protein FliK
MEQARISHPQGTQAPQASRSRHGGDASGVAASATSFLALLSAQDDATPQTGLLGDAAEQVANFGNNVWSMAPDAVPDAAEVSATVAWQGLVALDTPALQQASLQGGALAGIASDGLRQGLVAETALLDSAADLKESGLQGPVAGYGRILSRMQAALTQRAGSGGTSGAVQSAVGRTRSDVAMQHPGMVQHGSANSISNSHDISPGIASQPAGVHTERNGGLATATLGSESSPAGLGGVSSLGVSSRGADTPGGGRTGEGQSGGTSGADGLAGAAQLETGGVEDPSVFADPTQVSGEEYVTDQVAYWVNQKTQNAELTLDRDGQPVEVSVSLSGNEAHVTFRSDQSETRDLLDRSMAQLSDLLRSEGLVLAGMSVGTSARDSAGGSDAEQSRNRDGARQAQVVSSAPAVNPAEPRTSIATDRRVDLFV